jgi:hypothetical protein
MEGAGPGQSKERAPQPSFTFSEEIRKQITSLKRKIFSKDHVERVKVFVRHLAKGDISLGDNPVRDLYLDIVSKYERLQQLTLAESLSRSELQEEVSEMNSLLSELVGMIHNLKKMPGYTTELSPEQRNFVDAIKDREPAMRTMLVTVQGRAKPMPESEPENDEDLKKALRGMGLPAQ